MKKRTVFTRIVVLILALVLVTACGSPQPAPQPANNEPAAQPGADSQTADSPAGNGDKPLIGVLVWDFTNQYCTYIRNAIRHYGNEHATIELVDSQADQTKQNDQIDALLQRDVDALMVAMVQPTAAPTIIDKVKAYNERTGKHIPLIFWNQAPTPEDIALYDNAFYSGCDPYDGGVLQAQMAIDAIKANPSLYDKNGDGKIQYVILKGMAGHPDAELCTQGNVDTFEASTEVLFERLDIQNADWATAPAKDITDAWIGRYGDNIELILSNNDGMMLGAIEAFTGAGWFGEDESKRLLMIAHDGIPEIQTFIESGIVFGAFMQNPVEEGRGAVTMALNLLNGRPVEADLHAPLGDMKDYRAPFTEITKDNLHVAAEIYQIALGN